MRKLTILLFAIATAATAAPIDPAHFDSLRWREIGPYRGGRSAAVTGIPDQPLVYYFGSTGGGVWKTIDGGGSWMPVSDGYFGGSIGAVAVSESDPNVVYVGTGEKTVRGNVSHGDGIWKSTDAGATWTHAGLADSRHIPRIRIHPTDADVVYAAALGHLFGPSDERGVYRTTDGGKSWERILFVNRDTGAVDLILDPTNPRVLYATMWRVRRTPWSLESGGEGSSIWKSTDGGDSWVELTRRPGLPEGVIGISGITVSPSNPQNLYAIIEAEDGGVFRSRDGGETWTRTSDSRDLRQRAWYYTRIYAHPTDEESVYVLNVRFHYSKDGGRTYTQIPTPHGDNHDLWIDPDDPLRMIEGNDGGVNVSFDGGENWTAQDNQPTAQFYRISTDNAFPYRLLGAQQDNSAVRIRHRSSGAGIDEDDWEPTAGGESGHIVAKPDDPDVVVGGSYGGYLTIVNHRTGEVRDVNPWPDNPMGWGAAEITERFQWNFPILFSPNDPDTLYAASQHLFRSRDMGSSWERISPDLTRNDKSKMGPSGGPITKDNTSIEYYGTIFAVAESQHEPGVIWTGSDDGLIHVTRDGGATWSNVTPKGMPEWMQINSIEIHPFEPGGLYVAGTRYKLDDFHPYLYRTTDRGETWTRIDRGIPADQFTRVVRADPVRKGLLFAGTERGVWVSFDDGASWQSLQLELPIVPITDLAIKGHDLLAATQGRGFWSLDGLGILRQIAGGAQRLYDPERVWRMRGRAPRRPLRNQGQNPPNGAVVHYRIDDAVGTPVKLEFLDAAGNVIRTFEGKVTEEPEELEPKAGDLQVAEAAAEEEEEEKEKEKRDENRIEGVHPGMNRFVWNLEHPSAKKIEKMVLWSDDGLDGPRAIPGTYQVRLTADDSVIDSASFDVVQDPRTSATAEDLRAQFEFLIGIRDKLTETHEAIETIREIRDQLGLVRERVGEGPAVEKAKSIGERITEIEKALYQTKNQSPQDPLNYPIRLNDKLAHVASSASLGAWAPTAQAIAVRDELVAKIDVELANLRAIQQQDIPELNRLVREADVPAVVIPSVARDQGRAGSV
ncbi:MAG: WD40/YVTN/BNR-like repeat-containing protein [Thermoanaerobaculia bacterium]